MDNLEPVTGSWLVSFMIYEHFSFGVCVWPNMIVHFDFSDFLSLYWIRAHCWKLIRLSWVCLLPVETTQWGKIWRTLLINWDLWWAKIWQLDAGHRLQFCFPGGPGEVRFEEVTDVTGDLSLKNQSWWREGSRSKRYRQWICKKYNLQYKIHNTHMNNVLN